MAAAGRRAAREAERSARAAQKQHQRAVREHQRVAQAQHKSLKSALATIEKQQAQEHARLQAEEYEARVQVLRSVHADCSPVMDWPRLATQPSPPPPTINTYETDLARRALASYQPSFLDQTFGGAQATRAKLEAQVFAAEQRASAAHAAAWAGWQHAVALLQWQQRVAGGVLGGDVEAYRAVLEYWDVFDELEELGSAVEVPYLSSREAEIDLYVNGDDVIPTQSLTLLASGKLSTKALATGVRNLLFQDYVCGSALRIARELFAVLPLQRVLVHAIVDLLDASTGQIEAQPVLSVAMPRSTFARLNFAALDASDAMKNFSHAMSFSKTAGFRTIAALDRAALPPA